MELQEVLEQFQIEGKILEIKAHGNGHIHGTYQAINQDKDAPDYLMQKINHQIFQDVPGMMKNIQLVTEHLKAQSFSQKDLELVPTKKGEAYFEYDRDTGRISHFCSGKPVCGTTYGNDYYIMVQDSCNQFYPYLNAPHKRWRIVYGKIVIYVLEYNVSQLDDAENMIPWMNLISYYLFFFSYQFFYQNK